MKLETPGEPSSLSAFQTTVSLYAFTPSPSEGPSSLRRSARFASRLAVKKEETDALPALDLPTPPKSPRKRKIEEVVKDESSDSPSKRLKGKAKRGYAPPETYAHLECLSDHVAENLDVLFCGINPGRMSAEKGHHFAHPSNHFWRCLARSGLTSRLLPASEDHTLPRLFNLGLTNLVERPSCEAGELAAAEMASSVPALLAKIRRLRPRVMCFVGKLMWGNVERALKKAAVPPPGADQAQSSSRSASPAAQGKGKKPKKDKNAGYALQPLKVVHDAETDGAVRETLFFVVPSSSGRVVSHQLDDKVALFALLKAQVEQAKRGVLDTSYMSVVSLASE